MTSCPQCSSEDLETFGAVTRCDNCGLTWKQTKAPEERRPVEATTAIPLGGKHPDTSRKMRRKAAPRSGSLRAKVLRTICDAARGATDDELEVLLGLTHQSVSASRNTLARDGWITDSGERRNTRSGNRAIVWVPVETS